MYQSANEPVQPVASSVGMPENWLAIGGNPAALPGTQRHGAQFGSRSGKWPLR